MNRESAPIILIAEDDQALRARMARALRAHGCGVLEARTSVEALLLAVAYEGEIEALITSVELRTYSNGPELAHCMRVSRPEMRVIYLASEEVGEEATVDALIGEALIMPPPASPQDLKTLVSEVMAPRAPVSAKAFSYQRS